MSASARPAVPAAAPDKSPDRIAGMFDAIAPRYDLLNRLLSAGIDRRWRRRAIDSLGLTGREVLVDVATGTADVALEACAPRRGGARAARVVGVDFARAMLALGVGKVQAAGESSRVVLVHGDAMRLPVASGSADAVTIAFGIRNVQTASVACAEMARVLKPGGRAIFQEPMRNSALIRRLRPLIPYRAPDISPFERPLVDAEIDPTRRLRGWN